MLNFDRVFKLIVLLMASSHYSVFAASSIPSGVEPGRLLKEFEEPYDDLNRELKPLSVPETSRSFNLNNEFRFQLKSIRLEGNTVFSEEELEKLYKSKVNCNVTFSELKEISDEITLKYRNSGYVLARAILPQQLINSGVVCIKIFEGRVVNVEVNGKVKHVKSLLDAYAKKAGASEPFNITKLERYALLSNDIPGVAVKTILSPSRIQQGASDLTFVAEQHRTEGMIAADNRGTRYLGPVQYFARGNINSVFVDGDSLGIRTLIARKPSELSFLQLYQQHPLGKNGMYGAFSASYVYSHPGSTLKPLLIKGRANAFAYEISYPYLRSREKSLFLSMGFDILDSKTDVLRMRLFQDHLRSIRFTSTYVQEDKWLGTNTFRGSFSQGLPILLANSKNAQNSSRTGGRSVYSKLLLSLSRNQAMKGQTSIFTDFRFQYAATQLLAPEQFSYGGQQFGGAYDPSELTSDNGLVGKIELRYTTESAKPLQLFKVIQQYVFYDIGVLWSPVQVASKHTASATSTGFGIRIHFTNKTYLQGEVAQPLSRPMVVKNLHGKGPRAFFSFNQMF